MRKVSHSVRVDELCGKCIKNLDYYRTLQQFLCPDNLTIMCRTIAMSLMLMPHTHTQPKDRFFALYHFQCDIM